MNNCIVKKGKTLLLFYLLLMTGFGQLFANHTDSLENELVTATGVERLRLLDKLSFQLGRDDPKRAEKLALNGIELASSLNDSATLFSIYFNLGIILNRQNRFQEGIDRVVQGLNYFKRKGQNKDIGRGNLDLASIYSSKGDYSLADSLVLAALVDLNIAKDSVLIASTFNLRGTIQYYLKNYEAANGYYTESLNLSKAIRDTEQISYAMTNLGMVQCKLTNYPLALEYYFRSLELADDDLTRAGILNNISNVYRRLVDWESALTYQKEALEIKEKIGFPRLIASSLDNLGMIYKNMLNYGDALKNCERALAIKKTLEGEGNGVEITLNNLGNIHSRLGEYEKALAYYQQSLDICLKRNDPRGVGRAYFNMANTKFKTQKYEKAISLGLKSLQISQEQNDLAKQMGRNELLSEIYQEIGNSKKALKHAHAYSVLKDSIYSIKNLRKVSELENGKYQKELLAKNHELMQEEQRNLLQLKQFKWLFLGSVLLLLPIGFYFFKQKQTVKKLEVQQLVTLEKDNMLESQLNQLQEILLAQNGEEDSAELNPKKGVSQKTNASLTSMSDFLIENLNTAEDWTAFEHYFTQVHIDFFKKLKTSFPNITTNELNLSALLRLNLLNNEIGEVLGINSDSARRAQHRLAKKMNLSSNDALRTFLLKL